MVYAGGSHTARAQRTRPARMLGALLVAALLAAFATAALWAAPGRALAATATFGKTTIGGSSDAFVSERKRVHRYSLAAAGAVGKLTVYLAPPGTSGTQSLRGVIYEDASSKPAALLGTTN